MKSKAYTLTFCVDGDCNQKNDRYALMDEAEKFCESHGIEAEALGSSCLATCEHGPILHIRPKSTTYQCEDKNALLEILESHVVREEREEKFRVTKG